jgi:hypothetical protein
VIDQDPWNEKPSRRRRPRKTMDRSESEQVSSSELPEAISNEVIELPSDPSVEAEPEQISTSQKDKDAGSKKTGVKKERAVVTSDQISQSTPETDIDVTELARLKRSVQTRFFIFFVVGLVTIYFTSTLSKSIAIGSPIAIMALYVISTYKLTRLRTAKTLFADSVYYMGFLFTFVTLMFAISPEAVSISVIINQMGVALSTTIFGMLVRVIMSHFDGIEMNVDEDVFAKLSETANKIEAITDSLVNSSKEQVNQINATTAQALETTRKVQQTLDDITSDKFLSADRIRDMQTRMNAIADSLGDFDARIQDTNNSLLPLLEIMREASSISREFSDFRLKISHLDDLIGQMNSHISSTGKTAESASDLVDNLAAQIQIAKEEIAVHMANARDIEAHVEQRLVEIMKIVRTS